MSKNDGLTAFLQLSEHGRPCGDGPPSPRRAAIDLMTYADARGVLEVESAWRMSPAESRRMEDSLGYAPAGGWAALVALICGTGAFAATHHGFYPKQTVSEWQERSDDDVRTVLGEAFTRYLVPPAPAAALFMTLGVHPLWGLRLAKQLGAAGSPVFAEDDATRLFPDELLEVASMVTFGALGGLFAGMSTLEHDVAYPVDALVAFASTCFETAWKMATDVWEPQADAVSLFNHEEPRFGSVGAVQMTIDDILDGVLIPAGLARRYDDARFGLHPVISDLKVGHLDERERDGWLGFVTATEPRFLVA